MSQFYYAILTNAGEAKLANAIAQGVPLKLTHMGVGDGNGKEVTPDPTMTSLPGEQRRAAINTLFADPLNAAQLVAEQVIPADEGGWWVRCVGLYDEAGTLVAMANAPASFKPLLATGAGRTQVIRMALIVSNTAAVELKIDPAVVLATRKYCDDTMAELLTSHEQSRHHPSATATEKGLVRMATNDEARLGQAVDAVMSAKNVADAVKEMLKQMFVGIPLPWMNAEPPAWALNAAGQTINPTTDPILASRYPSGVVPDHRGMTIRGFDNGRGVDIGRALLSYQQDQIQQITGRLSNPGGTAQFLGELVVAEGAFATNANNKGQAIVDASSYTCPSELTFDSARVVRSGTETTVKSLAYNIIMMRG